ncbi:MAG: TetR/AcrR family transcriptional regulator [Actinomycetia bacterium]|nr:TetR/AcrR family transcriptional regulator [Actinomycetes bacterium]
MPGTTAVVRDKAATKARLLDAVGTILAREGFGALGVNAVAHEAGVDKVLIYRYFGGMTDLLHAFGQSGDFWPSITEVLGEDPSELMGLPLADRWAIGLGRYAEALRRRPVTKEILAWEQIEQNELTDILRQARGEWFEELMSHFPGDEDATDADLVGTVLLIVGAIHYFIVLSRLQDDFSGVVVNTDEGWAQISTVISGICQRTLVPRGETDA